MKTIEFRKMHGLGNDFVVVDARTKPFTPTQGQVRFIADRRRGVGCDQLIILEPSSAADVFMRIYNCDGTQAEACGNAMRCVGAILASQGVQKFTVETLRGLLSVQAAANDQFTVNMGAPIFTPAQIPVDVTDAFDVPELLSQYPAPYAVGMGNPHCVFVVDDADIDDAALQTLGSMIEVHPLFPAHTNVHFMSVTGSNSVRQRVFERGAGITGASGSGACAGAVTAIRLGLVQSPVAVALDGGTLSIAWGGNDGDAVFMTGPWAESYRGSLSLDADG